jgi:hypothetical protein
LLQLAVLLATALIQLYGSSAKNRSSIQYIYERLAPTARLLGSQLQHPRSWS